MPLFQYVRENIPGMMSGDTSRFEEEFQGCNCEGDTCSMATCACLQRSGKSDNYDEFGNLFVNKNGLVIQLQTFFILASVFSSFITFQFLSSIFRVPILAFEFFVKTTGYIKLHILIFINI